MDDYDCGLINDWGGGNVDWWQDYIRAEIGRANDHWRAQIAALTPATDGHAGMLAEARAIIFALVDDEPCRLDHHGYCQTHYLEKECSVQKGRDFLAKIKEKNRE